MADQIFRREWDYLMNVFGEPALGWYYPDYRDVVRNTYGEIIGGTVYLVRQCPMRGLVIEEPLTFRNLEDGSGEVQFIGLKQAVTFKVSASDLIKGGVLTSDGSYEVADNPNTTVIEGVLNHKYIIYRGQMYEVVNFDRGVIFRGDPSNAYITCTRDVDYVALNGKAQLVIQDTPDTPPVETFSVTVDNQLWGMYAPGTTVVLTTPTKEGYTFKGWSSQEVNVVNNTFTMPSQTVVVNSLWDKVVTPDPDVTYLVYVDSVLLGEYAPGTVVTLDTPTKPGYDFSGWTSTDVTMSGNTFTMPDKDVSVTSTWTAVTSPTGSYKITVVNPCTSADATLSGDYEVEPYQLEDGSWSEPVLRITAGNYYSMHNFSGWKVTSGSGTFLNAGNNSTLFYPDTKQTTIEAVWVAVSDPRHTVTFVGIDRAEEKYETGATVSCYAGYKEGYDFKKWSAVPSVTFSPRSTSSNVSFTMPDSDVVVTAEWAVVEYTVTFMVDGVVFNTVTTPANTPITVSDPSKEGYTFDGWYTSGGNPYDLSDGVTNDLTLTAHFTGVPRTITFDSDGGSEVESITVENGQVLGQLPTATKEGFNLAGWTYNGEPVYPTTIVTTNMTLIAVWTTAAVTEAGRIDLSSEYTADVLRQGLYFNSSNGNFLGDYSVTSGGYNNRRVKQSFYLGDWGTDLPPVEFTTEWADLKWPKVHPISTVMKMSPITQQTILNLYSKRAPGAEEYSCDTPGWGGGVAVTTSVMGLSPVNEYTVPTANTMTPVLLCVTEIEDGWYRYEWGFVKGVNKGNNGNIGSILEKPVSNSYPLE